MVSAPLLMLGQGFAASSQAMMITDANGNIFAVNPAFTAITGYDARDVVGRRPSLMQSGRQDAAFYTRMWGALKNQGHWEGEIWNRRKSGEIFAEYLHIDAICQGGADCIGATGLVRDGVANGGGAYGGLNGAGSGFAGAGHGVYGYWRPDCAGRRADAPAPGRGEAACPVNYFATFSDITARKRAEDEMHQLAFYDHLTGLPNRALFEDRLDRAVAQVKRSQSPLAVAVIDMDGFKQLNDRFGHWAGDKVLKTVARRLTGRLRDADTVARWGGDEFTVLLPDIGSIDNALATAAKMRKALSADVRIEGQRVPLHASIGLSLCPQHASSACDLLCQADAAMYRAKKDSRTGCRIHSPMAA